jgi:hypothetical protein
VALRPVRVTLAAFVFAAGAAVAFVAGVGAGPADAGYDETPPTITCSANPATLRPANDRLRAVTVRIKVTDASPTTFTLVSVTSSPSGSADDIVGWDIGTNDTMGSLRAENLGGTRTYTLVYRAVDSSGNDADCTTTVTV